MANTCPTRATSEPPVMYPVDLFKPFSSSNTNQLQTGIHITLGLRRCMTGQAVVFQNRVDVSLETHVRLAGTTRQERHHTAQNKTGRSVD